MTEQAALAKQSMSRFLVADGAGIDVGVAAILGSCTVVVLRAVDAPTQGYLSATPGEVIEVLYDGSSTIERSWIYGRAAADSAKHGWLPKCAFQQSLDPVLNGVARTAVSSLGPGYLALESGDLLLVLYVGSATSAEAGWLFGAAAGTLGWCSAECVDLTHDIRQAHDGTNVARAMPNIEAFEQQASRASPGSFASAATPLRQRSILPQSSLGRAMAAAEPIGLKLLGVAASSGIERSVGLPWHYPLRNPQRRSFVGYLPAQANIANGLLKKVMDGMDMLGWERPASKMGRMTRGTKWMVARGCCCRYNYGGISVRPVEFPRWMKEIMAAYMPLCGLDDPLAWPNSCNLNCYSDGTDALDWHADDEPLFAGRERDIRIISLSLGQERNFEFRLASADQGDLPSVKLSLANGDLCTMEGLVQRHYEHRVPKGGKASRLRVNLTWRWIVAHEKRCSC